MSYYRALIERKFRDLAGSRYEQIQNEYRDFIPTEEELQVAPVKSILVLLDFFSGGLPGEVSGLLSTYHAPVTLVYLIDDQVLRVVSESLGTDTGARFLEHEEDQARDALKRICTLIEEAGTSCRSLVRTGTKGDEAQAQAQSTGLLVLGKKFGMTAGDNGDISPMVLRLQKAAPCPVIIY
jgi:hypothetical protein